MSESITTERVKWALEVDYGDRWERVYPEGDPSTFATKAEAWELAQELYPDSEYLSAMCRVVEVSHAE